MSNNYNVHAAGITTLTSRNHRAAAQLKTDIVIGTALLSGSFFTGAERAWCFASSARITSNPLTLFGIAIFLWGSVLLTTSHRSSSPQEILSSFGRSRCHPEQRPFRVRRGAGLRGTPKWRRR